MNLKELPSDCTDDAEPSKENHSIYPFPITSKEETLNKQNISPRPVLYPQALRQLLTGRRDVDTAYVHRETTGPERQTVLAAGAFHGLTEPWKHTASTLIFWERFSPLYVYFVMLSEETEAYRAVLNLKYNTDEPIASGIHGILSDFR
ncbi:unnamed protein product [Protopolystoma xenopodis]|uniref:Uncharacterized protein n=1 Tax=Protopolystoma xenopodis TaxID=117903 RepID=A0A448X4M1_9PLAT|nr:unnamed protein product [Protopolystoma xenopodis]